MRETCLTTSKTLDFSVEAAAMLEPNVMVRFTCMWGDEQSSVVQCFNRFLETTQSFDQLQLHGHDQVHSSPGDRTNNRWYYWLNWMVFIKCAAAICALGSHTYIQPAHTWLYSHSITDTVRKDTPDNREYLPGEKWMFSLVQHNDDVTWLKSWLLISLSVENQLLTISHSCGRWEDQVTTVF